MAREADKVYDEIEVGGYLVAETLEKLEKRAKGLGRKVKEEDAEDDAALQEIRQAIKSLAERVEALAERVQQVAKAGEPAGEQPAGDAADEANDPGAGN